MGKVPTVLEARHRLTGLRGVLKAGVPGDMLAQHQRVVRDVHRWMVDRARRTKTKVLMGVIAPGSVLRKQSRLR